jgi:hypothetical protein
MKRALVLALLAGCTPVVIPQPTLLDAQRSGVPLSNLQEGRALFTHKCTRCHTAVGPLTISSRDWPAHVDEMAERAKLTAPEHALIVKYLTSVSR